MPGILRSQVMKVVVCLWLCFVAQASFGQSFNMEQDRVQMAELKGLWRFHTGDDPRWAAPGFDDSSWTLLRSDQSWSEQGYPGYSGMAWYRFQVVVPPKHGPLALWLSVETNYEVYVNGRLVGRYGTMPPGAVPYDGLAPVLAIPLSAGASGQPIEVAIRVWHWPVWASYYGGGAQAPSRIGDAAVMAAWHATRIKARYWLFASDQVQLVLSVLSALAAFGFYLMYRLDREYLWFGLYELGYAGTVLLGLFSYFGSHPHIFLEILGNTVWAGAEVMFLTFLCAYFRQRRGALYWSAVAVKLVDIPANFLGVFGFISVPHMNLSAAWCRGAFTAFVLLTLVSSARRRHRDATLLIVFVSLDSISELVQMADTISFTAGHPALGAHLRWFYNLSTWPFPISVPGGADTLMQVAILAVLIARFARGRRDEQRLQSEMEAARSVQHVMIPEEIPAIAGLRIEAVYRPASEVGGDFFQVIPLGEGSVLIAVGDVSGKGVPAAMTVSLLVGTLRSLAKWMDGPAALLAGMNAELEGRSSGFTTCVLARIDGGRTVTLANAGHMAPYLGGREVLVENGLPLGLTGEASYAETTLVLAEGEQLTFMTDGIVEAKSARGQLFGFEQAQALAGRPAAAIAETAQQFGQEDDITVVTVARTAVRVDEGSVVVESVLRGDLAFGGELS